MQKNLSRLKLYIIKRKFNFLDQLCHLFHLVKRENVYFIRGFATHYYAFLAALDEINGLLNCLMTCKFDAIVGPAGVYCCMDL